MLSQKSILTIHVYFFLFTFIYSQEYNEFNVTIESIGIGSLTADQIVFDININISDKKEPKVAHEKHRRKIEQLSDLLKNYNIADDQIKYSLFSIRKSRKRGDSQDEYLTDQHVSIILKEMAKHEEFQMALIKNGITSFRTRFSTSKSDELEELAITNGLEKAEQKIKIIAENMNMKTYNIENINLKERSRARYRDEVIVFSASGERFESIPQKVNYIVDIVIEYKLSKK